MKIHIKKQEHR